MDKLGIDFISGFAMPPTALLKLAADLDCATISIVLEPIDYNPEGYPHWSLKDDAGLRREMLSIMRDRGVSVALGEGFIISPDHEAKNYGRELDIMAELGVAQVNAISFDPDLARSFDQIGVVAEMAAKAGLSTVTEFAPCFSMTDLPTALACVKHVGRSDYRVLIDTMHLARSGGTAADLAALDPDLIGYVQFCDVPLKPTIASYLEEGMYERCVPGEGEVPLADILKALPRDVVISVEVPQRSKAEAGLGPEARLGHCIRATRRLMSGVDLAVS